MKKIFLFILCLFTIFVSTSVITKADEIVYDLKIKHYNIYESNESNSLNYNSSYFTSTVYSALADEDIIDGCFYFEGVYSYGWIFKGYYQIIDGTYVYYDVNEMIPIEALEFEFYEYWKKNTYDFTYYIFYNKNDVPQEFYIDGILEFNDFIVKFPTSYKNLTATSFKTTDGSILTIDEIYDGYLTSVSNNSSSYGILNAEFKIKNEIEDEPVEDTDDKFVFSEWWNEIGFEIKLIVLIIFLLIILLILSLFTGKRRYRRKW
ncbi:MAG: hypothetical protein E7183_07805 [Erysipelotrichaceae bacterium]|nr:hypothetical protein [Erysipelotrichaceae bacterium]